MADFEGALPIKSVRDDDVKFKLVDYSGGETSTTGLAIDVDGEIGVKVRDVAGDTLGINTDGSINVVLGDGGKLPVCSYNESLAVAKNGSVDFDYVVTSGKTFKGYNILVGSRGAVKIVVGTYDGTTLTTKATFFQLPAQNRTTRIPTLNLLGDGTASVRVTVINLDNTTDLSATIMGYEE